MESKEDKQLEALAKKVFLEAKEEKVSFDFTSKVMSQIEKTSSQRLVYKPLVPKAVWGIILTLLIVWVGYLFQNHFTGSSEWFMKLDLDSLFSGFQLSKSVTYTIILFALMLCVQVGLLKHYFNKRLTT